MGAYGQFLTSKVYFSVGDMYAGHVRVNTMILIFTRLQAKKSSFVEKTHLSDSDYSMNYNHHANECYVNDLIRAREKEIRLNKISTLSLTL